MGQVHGDAKFAARPNGVKDIAKSAPYTQTEFSVCTERSSLLGVAQSVKYTAEVASGA